MWRPVPKPTPIYAILPWIPSGASTSLALVTIILNSLDVPLEWLALLIITYIYVAESAELFLFLDKGLSLYGVFYSITHYGVSTNTILLESLIDVCEINFDLMTSVTARSFELYTRYVILSYTCSGNGFLTPF